ncbi:uncharacterized protein LOC126840611 [Adelges cooleyi]|uniref:uncharacterized protein LOC126840611 n=1 Tax=Adelges cooleyi TaxID=133065 RepID=UPI00217FD337|nr:uncharacterized protein LOC126840611 [Adelges cooleyi]
MSVSLSILVILYSTALLLLIISKRCDAAKNLNDSSDYEGDDDLSSIDGTMSLNDLSITPKEPEVQPDYTNLRCTDPNTNKKYKVGDTWFPDGCGQRSCIFSEDNYSAQILSETCRCRTCPPGTTCSIIRRAVSANAQYPHCCPLTTCIEVYSRLYFWKKIGSFRHW